MDDVKYCRYCEQTKAVTEFQKHRGKCRPCRTLETREWNRKNKQHHAEYQKNYKSKQYKNNLHFKIKQILRSRLRKAVVNDWKIGSAVDLLGCTVADFKIHLESKFLPGMTWSNWTKDGWHIDHIVPLDHFDLNSAKELSEACHYTNMQPMWSTDNCSKSNKVQ